MLDSDCIIYDLTNCDVKECEFAIKTLKMNDFSDTKFFLKYKDFLFVWVQFYLGQIHYQKKEQS